MAFVSRRALRAILASFILALCGFVAALALSGIFANVTQAAEIDQSVLSQSVSSQSVLSQSASLQGAIAEGVAAFNREAFAAAVEHWQTALVSSSESDLLTRAYLLSSSAAAYLRLSRLDMAQVAVAQSLELLDSVEPKADAAYWGVAGRALNTQGQVQWQQGQAAVALSIWQQAEARYRRAQAEPVGLLVSQINQAIALQELGFNAQAANRLTQLAPEISALPPDLQRMAAKELARALRGIGELSSAQQILSEQLKRVPAGTVADAQLHSELGHTLRAMSHRAIAIGQAASAKDYAEQTIEAYRAAAVGATDTLQQVQAKLNWLSYLTETGALDEAAALAAEISLSDLPAGRAGVEAYISYGHTVSCLNVPTSEMCVQQAWRKESVLRPAENTDWISVIQTLKMALTQAEALEDKVLVSYALGELGHAYELAGQYGEAIELSERALRALEGRNAPEVAYRWEWQMGRLYRLASSGLASSERSQAMGAYQQALASLAEVRQNLLLIDPQVQFSFRDNVEPVYREFVSLLLDQQASSVRTMNSNKSDVSVSLLNQDSLKLAVQTLDALQLTELENFLGCNLSQLVNLNESNIDSNAIKIYPIILPSQLAIIYEISDQPLGLLSVPVSQSEVEQVLVSLQENLIIPGKTPAVLSASEQLYRWLIEPLGAVLARNEQIETLVFVPDGLLRNVPFGVLYDGEEYLIEKPYGLAIAPQLDLFAPRKTPQQLRVLRGGIELSQTIRGQQFPPIELVRTELEQIPDSLTVAPPLLNEAFTQANIEQQLKSQRYSAIHWKTHGVFSSAPAETFLVAYQEGITANELSQLVQSANERQNEPLELLVLSACETAQGDSRAVLGLAGIAVRAGTRSTLSTLWRADDGANTELMAVFYEGMTAGLSKAQALQKAQRALLSDAGYPAPYYWAPYVLVGNWL